MDIVSILTVLLTLHILKGESAFVYNETDIKHLRQAGIHTVNSPTTKLRLEKTTTQVLFVHVTHETTAGSFLQPPCPAVVWGALGPLLQIQLVNTSRPHPYALIHLNTRGGRLEFELYLEDWQQHDLNIEVAIFNLLLLSQLSWREPPNLITGPKQNKLVVEKQLYWRRVSQEVLRGDKPSIALLALHLLPLLAVATLFALVALYRPSLSHKIES